MKSCSAFKCPTETDSGKFFYKFPANFDLCMKWVQNMKDDLLWQEFQYGGASPFIERHVCSDHFSDSDFVLFGNRESGLRSNAVPFKIALKPVDLLVGTVKCVGNQQKISRSIDRSKVRFLAQLGVSQKDEFSDNFSIKAEAIDEENGISRTDPTKTVLLEQHLIPSSHCGRSSFKLSAKLLVADNQRKNETAERRMIRLEKNRLRNVVKRHAETEDEAIERRQKSAQRASKTRTNETEEQRLLRLEKSRIRAAEKRKNMAPEEREHWRLKNRLQTRERRQNEDEVKTLMRRYSNAVRASLKRSLETDEERMERRYKDALRAAERRKTETPDERNERLRKDRERVQMRRMEIKITETPEQREERLRKERERMYKKRHQTPEMISILKSIHDYFNRGKIKKEHINLKNLNNLMRFVRNCHSDLSVDYLKTAVENMISMKGFDEFGKCFTNQMENIVSIQDTGQSTNFNTIKEGASEDKHNTVEQIEVKPELSFVVMLDR